MMPLILITLVVVTQAPADPSVQRAELAAPEGPAMAPIAETTDGPTVPYPQGDVRAELLAPDLSAAVIRFSIRYWPTLLTAWAMAFALLGGYVAMAKHRAPAEGVVIGALFGPVGVVVVGLLPEPKGQGVAS